MKYHDFLVSILLLSLSSFVQAQVTAGFENITVPAQGYLNDASPEPSFRSGLVRVPNRYDADFDYWEGWAISAVTDNQTPGFGNQYSAIPGGGAEGTAQYSVAYAYDGAVMHLAAGAAGKPVDGLYLTNNTYTYYSMRDGDAFAKRFGGESGNDPDYFLLSIRGWREGALTLDSISFYLADYRFADNQQDYLIQAWTWVDLQGLGVVDSLFFRLHSSDSGAFGMNTPAYFCVDEVRTAGDVSGISNHPSALPLTLWPNPTRDQLQVKLPAGSRWLEVLDATGRTLLQRAAIEGHLILDVASLPAGSYTLRAGNSHTLALGRFIRE